MSEKDRVKKEMTLDDLATIVQSSILDLKSELKSDIKEIENNIKVIKSDVKEVKSDTEDIKADLNKKVGRIEHNDLIYRVEKLEKNFA